MTKKKKSRKSQRKFTVNGKEFNENSQEGLTLKVLMQNKDKEMTTQQIVDIASAKYEKLTGKKYREITGRAIRKLRERGLIHQIEKGIYLYNGVFSDSKIAEFTPEQREEILKRDNYTCLICAKTKKEGALLTADHMDAQSTGGKAEISNGMCLCTTCQNRKKNYGLKSFGKKMFEKFHAKAIKNKDENVINFTKKILDIFDKYKQV